MAEIDIIDGKAIASSFRHYLKGLIDTDALVNHINRKPSLRIVRVGNDPASEVYCRQKKKACEEVGIDCKIDILPSHSQALYVMNVLRRYSLDEGVDGIILQLPLPDHLKKDQEAIINAIDPNKDADCLTRTNYGRLFTGSTKDAPFLPCTPFGIKELLHIVTRDISKCNVVIIGRSKLVGAPLAKILTDLNATVTLCHSKTQKESLDILCRNADIIITAVGNGKSVVTADMLTPGKTIIIDVGINRGKDGKLYGDVDFDNCKSLAKAITPVPGGVGPMTVTMLMFNVYYAWRAKKELIQLSQMAGVL